MGDRGDGLATLGGVDFAAASGDELWSGNRCRRGDIRYGCTDRLEFGGAGGRDGRLGRRCLRGLGLSRKVGRRMRTEPPGSGGEQETGNSSDDSDRRNAQEFLRKPTQLR